MNITPIRRAKPDINVLVVAIRESQNPEKLELQRNVSLGGAAVTSAILVALTQVGTKELALTITTIAASASLPFWVALAFLYEMYIHLGPRSHKHYSTRFPQAIIRFLAWPCLIGILVAMGGIVWYLYPGALVGLLFAILLAFLAYGVFMYELAEWWQTNDAPSDSSRDG